MRRYMKPKIVGSVKIMQVSEHTPEEITAELVLNGAVVIGTDKEAMTWSLLN